MAQSHARDMVYANIKFPEYSYAEYPMFIATGEDEAGRPTGVIVNNDAERKIAEGGEKVYREEDERAELLQRLYVKGIQHDKRWGVDKLRAALGE